MQKVDSYLSLAKALPLDKGDILFIASDIKQLALNARSQGERFDVNAFIESFQEVLTEGTLIIPAYTDFLKNGETFDWNKAKPTTGALSNKVFRRKDFVRTLDPLHSVFVWGKHQNELAQLDGNSTLGKGSVFDFLYTHKAKMICIDVDFQNSLTFVHYVEEKENVNYRKPYQWKINRVVGDSRDLKGFTFHTKKPWVLTDLYGLQASSVDNGVNTLYTIEGVQVQYFDLSEMHQFILNYIKEGNKLYTISLMHFVKGLAKKLLRKS
jgi:aminoglycoside N3'-acetyltransferase